MVRVLILTILLISVGNTWAANTKMWKVANEEDFLKGTPSQVSITNQGELTLGPKVTKLETGEISVWSALSDSKGITYFGTGNNGKILKLTSNKLEELQTAEGMVITALALDKKDVLYASSIPGSNVYKMADKGKMNILCTLPETYIWCMAAGEDVVYAGTGSQQAGEKAGVGKIYKITADGKFSVLYETKENHILSLALDKEGNVYAGSSMNGLIYKITQSGKGEIVADLDEHEIRKLVISENKLYIGANKAKKFEPDRFVKQLKSAAERAKRGEEIESPFKNLFDGSLYQMELNGGARLLFQINNGYITDLVVNNEQKIIVSSGDEGKVFLVSPGEATALLFDFPENQALSLAPNKDGKLVCIGMGNPGSVYTIDAWKSPEGNYISETKDSGFISKWGHITWDGKGEIKLATRTGNTLIPDDSWSKWSENYTNSPAKVTSPAGRYIQVKVTLHNPESILRWFVMTYMPENQQPVFKEMAVEGQDEEAGFKGKTKESAEVKIRFKAEDADGDELVFYLYSQKDGQEDWASLNKDAFAKKEFNWNTALVPDGWYRVKVVATDEKHNSNSLVNFKVTKPFLVDNSKPAFVKLDGNEKSYQGVVEDAFSQIARIEYAIDEPNWKFISPKDGLYDQKKEEFTVNLEKLNPGRHHLMLKVFDALGNIGLADTFFTVK